MSSAKQLVLSPILQVLSLRGPRRCSVQGVGCRGRTAGAMKPYEEDGAPHWAL